MQRQALAFTENLLNLAAVIYHPEDDADGILADFALAERARGVRVGGVVQRNRRGDCGPAHVMALIDLMTDETIPICQALGAGSLACKLDQAGLADGAQAVARAIAADAALIVVNKFGKMEAEGRGLRAEIAAAILDGRPVLTAVASRHYNAWREFTGGFGTTLFCDSAVIADWWSEIARRGSICR